MSIHMTHHGVSDAYNAKWLNSQEIAKSFVPPIQFNLVSKNRNSFLVGPRGSGKTTLLKMLQLSALDAWQAPEAQKFRDEIAFIGVFIPADISWKYQFDSSAGDWGERQAANSIGYAAFTTHIIWSILDVMIYRSTKNEKCDFKYSQVALPSGAEAEIVRNFSTAIQATPEIPTLISLKRAVSHRLVKLATILNQERVQGESGRNQRLASFEFLHLDPMATASYLIEIFDSFTITPDVRWALMFDELEIVPESIQKLLFASLRSTDPKIILKLALSPYNSTFKEFNKDSIHHDLPSTDNDFDPIQLWNANKKPGEQSTNKYEFCRNIWTNLAESRGMNGCDPELVLGSSHFESDIDPTIIVPMSKKSSIRESPYAPGKSHAIAFQALYKRDRTFRQYIEKYPIDINRLEKVEIKYRNTVVRKVAPIVAVREFYQSSLGEEDLKGRLRSRKAFLLFTGTKAIYDLSEGHPRWIKRLFSNLLDQYEKHGKITKSAQANAIGESTERFVTLLETLPVGNENRLRNIESIFDLINVIGTYFHNAVVREPFSAEPPLSFVIDKGVSEEIIHALEKAINLGALVYLPDSAGKILINDIVGKRFRLSHWLAPIFGLPLITGKEINLTKILQHHLSHSFNPSYDAHQPDLFEGEL